MVTHSQTDFRSHFLEVLNVYHSQQQSISDVLEQIAGLFADETDLLSEFAHFLPPSAQEQVKLSQALCFMRIC